MAWTVAGVFTASLSAPALAGGHAAADRVEFVESGLVTPHPVEQFEDLHPPADAEHCPICHWLRAVSGVAPPAVASTHVRLDVRAGVAGYVSQMAARQVADDRSSRAPPASHL